MGQLEKYGLYVLCLVICMILGVAIWGEGPKPAAGAESNTVLVTGDTAGLNGSKVRNMPTESDIGREFANFLDTYEIPSAARAEAIQATQASAPSPSSNSEGSTAPAPAPASEPLVYVVKDGDNLEAISKRFYGKRHQWRKIQKANPKVNPRKLRQGMKLVIPAPSATSPVATASGGNTSTSKAPKTYKVAKGDSLARISKRFFQTEDYADDIMALNDISNPRNLQIGMVLKLPKRK